MKCSNLFFCRLTPRVLLLELLLLLLENPFGARPAVSFDVAGLAALSTLGPVFRRSVLLGGLLFALLAAAACVVLATAELRFEGGYLALRASFSSSRVFRT